MRYTILLCFLVTLFLFACQQKETLPIKAENIKPKFEEVSKLNYLLELSNKQIEAVKFPCGNMAMNMPNICHDTDFYLCSLHPPTRIATLLQKGRKDPSKEKLSEELFWFDNPIKDPGEGLYRVVQNDKIGFADKEGKLIIPPSYSKAYTHRNSKAKVQDGSKYWKYIDRMGQIIPRTKELDEASYLIKKFEAERDEVGVPSGYHLPNGKEIIPVGKYYYCYSDTLRNFAIVKKRNGPLVAIDRYENELYEVHWYDNGPDYIKDGLFRIKIDNKFGYANEQGEIVIPPKYDCAHPFNEGKAKVSMSCSFKKEFEHTIVESEEWFYITKEGKKITN